MQALTHQQIESICNSIPINPSLPKKVGESIAEKIRKKLRNDLIHVKLYPQMFEAYKKEILHYYHTTLVQAGEAVGIITAQSIGERQTQTTLSSFHSTGLTIKTVIVGVPRFSELLNATKDPKMVNCIIYLNKNFDSISEIRDYIGNSFTEILLKRLVKSYEILDEPLEEWHHLFCKVFNINKKLSKRIRFFLNIDITYEYKVKMKLIKKQIEKYNPSMTVLYTPESKGIIDIFIEKKEEILSEEDEEEEEVIEEDEEEVIEEIYDDIDDDIDDEVKVEKVSCVKVNINVEKDKIPYDIEEMIIIEDKIIPSLMNIKISGISKVKEIFFEKRKIKDEEKWIITTEGSNLYGIFTHSLVDKTKTLCNNMWEIYNVFGIEATRQFLISEFMDVVTSDGTFVNKSHVELLVDMMVYTGTIISISRYGQKKVGSGPLSKASFEESLENFLKAGLNGEKETTDGVSASIILGKLPKTGTGVFDLKVDIDKIRMKKDKEIDIVPPLTKKTGKINSFFL